MVCVCVVVREEDDLLLIFNLLGGTLLSIQFGMSHVIEIYDG